jgi:O-antigen/teichoic acid export membrane protein
VSGGFRKRLASGVAWIGAASTVVGALDAVAIALLLKYWVKPQDLGVVTLAALFFPLLDVVSEAGIAAAIVQRRETDRRTLSAVFWLSTGLAVALLGIVAVLAPAYGAWRGHPTAGWILLVYACKLPLSSAFVIPQALLRRELRFQELSVIRIFANLAEFGGKVGLAAAGEPIWCFVVGPLLRVTITGIGAQIVRPFLPRFSVDLRRGLGHMVFGLKASLSQLFTHAYSNADYMIVEIWFGTAALGLYRTAYDLVLYPVKFMTDAVVTVALPAFAKLRGERAALGDQLIAFTRQSLMFVVPFLAVMFVAAEDALALLFPNYQGAAGAVRILCAAALLRAMAPLFAPLLDGMGRPGVTLAHAALAAVILIPAFAGAAALFGDRMGFQAVPVGWAAAYPLVFLIIAGMGLAQIRLAPWRYLKGVFLFPVAGAAALAAGLAVRDLASGLPRLPRLLLVALAVLGAAGGVLRLRGEHPIRQARSLRAARRQARQPTSRTAE